ncbi:MAG: hypothetical protein GWN00_19595, partial [Aliifodinibius sp.]|nr:hypothetical protein [Fodinibius sp.]NIV13272.1 hypothetical protein [Fodinibius sp.]NIY26927.1 hypothetical protein [Fodinibius sp.]
VGVFTFHFNNPNYAGYKMDSLSVQLSTSDNIVHLNKLLAVRDSLVVLAIGEYSLLRSQGDARMGFFRDEIQLDFDNINTQILTTFDLSNSSNWKMDLTGRNLELD